MKKRIKEFQPAKWNEPILMTMTSPGERGIIVPRADEEIEAANSAGQIPAGLRRSKKPELPELSQPQVYRHFLHLSQETMGQAVTPDISEGTCTMKYSPLINERLCAEPNVADMHPYQPVSTMQGSLKILWELEKCLKEISGMDAFTFQPGGGSQAIYTNACIIRAYHEANGNGDQKNEIITTACSHPADAAAPNTCGYKVIQLYPEENGYPSVEALKAVVSEHTAGLMITNPEDTGIYNPHMKEFVEIIHSVGGLCAYDQANANGILGVARAKEAGFDLCHFNLHKTFGSPHGSNGPACGASGVRKGLEQFLPTPIVTFDGENYNLNYDLPLSIGKIRSFLGNVPVMVRSYAWIAAMGADGLRKTAEISVLNNNYMTKKMCEIKGIGLAYDTDTTWHLEQTRYTCEEMFQATGVTGADVRRRISDYGLQSYHESHYPVLIPNPITLEPTETYSKADIDYYIEVFKEISEDAYQNPAIIKNAPQRCLVSEVDEHGWCSDEATRAMTWRAFVRKHGIPEFVKG